MESGVPFAWSVKASRRSVWNACDLVHDGGVDLRDGSEGVDGFCGLKLEHLRLVAEISLSRMAFSTLARPSMRMLSSSMPVEPGRSVESGCHLMESDSRMVSVLVTWTLYSR